VNNPEKNVNNLFVSSPEKAVHKQFTSYPQVVHIVIHKMTKKMKKPTKRKLPDALRRLNEMRKKAAQKSGGYDARPKPKSPTKNTNNFSVETETMPHQRSTNTTSFY